jgi:hypothetical protein
MIPTIESYRSLALEVFYLDEERLRPNFEFFILVAANSC